MTDNHPITPNKDDCDLLVIAIQALYRPEADTHDLEAVEKGTAILRNWLARHGLTPAQHKE
jgi:hypothetical protein